MAVLIQCKVLIPGQDNKGNPFPANLMFELAARIAEASPEGWTMAPGRTGAWRDPDTGNTVVEPLAEVVVGLKSWFELPGFLDLVAWAREAYSQAQVWLDIAGVAEVWPDLS